MNKPHAATRAAQTLHINTLTSSYIDNSAYSVILAGVAVNSFPNNLQVPHNTSRNRKF